MNPDPQVLENLIRHVDRFAGLIGPRHVGRPSSLLAAERLIQSEWTQSGYSVERQPLIAGGIEVANLVATIRGEQTPNEIVILGAHYDTVPATPGADDNASALAVLLEVARLFRSLRPRRTVRWVAFACEEAPFFHTNSMGSQAYARLCRERNEQIRAMLCLEMVGYFTSRPRSQSLPPGIPKILRPLFPTRGDFLAAVGNLKSWRLVWQFRRGFKRATRFPLFSIALPDSIPEIRLSDNRSFWDEGYPALMLTDTSFLRNPHYHKPTDTPETLDYPSMAQVTMGVFGAMARLAGARL